MFQGDKVRELKATKAEKAIIDAAVAELLDLKKKLASAEAAKPPAAAAPSSANAADLALKVNEQVGNY